ncbi:DUF2564 family protein [Bacillus solimangrovi]|uniref:DUF2564 domain-containing protein n=1 Tax=Bacillus solimangrovi TaxID=1305675 RepID=A0A1E5LFI8_9BACI|nr:DUF2564 family protein [Bacillus solimangrovi]OEH92847.1 hypothetical protein BFG57_02305 [Bacillus solimangrovi]
MDKQFGFNQQEQVEMSVKAAQKMVGAATMNMEPDALDAAQEALNNAKQQLQSIQTDPSSEAFIAQQQIFINRCQEQLSEALH